MINRIRERLMNYTARKQKNPDLKPASVLLPLYEKEGELYLLFTCRTEKVEHHKGQISFPGGMRDAADPDARSTAIRETWEEIGLEPGRISVIGELDDLETVSGFNVTPFVGEVRVPFSTRISEAELSDIFSAPLSFFLEGSNSRPETAIGSGGEKREYWVFQFGKYRIWGATADIVRNFVKVIS